MSSSSLQRLPSGTHRFNQQYRLIAVAFPVTRHYTAQAGRTKLPIKYVRNRSQDLDKAVFLVLKGKSDGPLPPPETASRLFEPLPRRAKQHHINKTFQLHASFIQEAIAREQGPVLTHQDGEWEDVDVDELETRLEIPATRSRLVNQNASQLLPNIHPSSLQSINTNAKLQKRTRPQAVPWNRHSVNRDTVQADASLRNIHNAITFLQSIEVKLQATDRQLQELALRLGSQQPSSPGAASQRVRKICELVVRWLSHFPELMKKASEAAVQTPPPTKWQMFKAMTAAAFCIGGTTVLAPLLKAMLSFVWVIMPSLHELPVLYPNIHDWLGLVVHTSSLPLLIAMNTRAKKACRRFKHFSISKNLLHTHQRRQLTQSSQNLGPRKETAFRELIANHPELLDKPFPMSAVLNDLRNLQALRGSSSGREYKVAERRLFRVQHESELGQGAPLTVRQVTKLLEPDDSVGWTVIKQRLLLDRVDAIDSLSKEDRARVMFQRVYGIGATKAERFVQAGFLTLEQLREASLERAQRIGLNHMNDIECLIPRSESQQWLDVLLDVVRSVDSKLSIELLGSFRRGDHYSSDLDFVLFHPDVIEMRLPRPDNPSKSDPHPLAATLLNNVIVQMRKRNLLADDLLAHGPLAVKGIVRLSATNKARRIDLNFAPFIRRAFYTLAKTGDADLMVHLRAKAKSKGWALNEYGLGPPNQNGSAWTTNLLQEATDERQIFAFLNVPYLKPKERSFSNYASKLKITRP